jgi:uncharacterized membrane protein required for colicin V production
MGWFDIFLLVVFILHVINGLVRGFVKQIFDICGFFLIIIGSFWGSRYFSESLAGYIKTEDIIPHHEIIQTLGIDMALEKAPQLIAGILAFLILFLVLSIAFRFFSSGFRWINRIPVIGFFNRLGGAFLGAVIGAVFVYIIIAGVAMIPLSFFVEALENSEGAYLADFYLRPVAQELKDLAIKFYLSLNG